LRRLAKRQVAELPLSDYGQVMGRRRNALLNFVLEGVGEAIFEAILIAGPLWLINYFFGPFHAPDWVSTAVAAAFGVLGLIMFVAIGISRHPEAYKVRIFGAAVAGVFVVGLLFGVVSRLH
jgi:hypothetical protein